MRQELYMASDRSESPSRKRRHYNHSKRDQPLFASRRTGPSLQQPPDFLTESLNTTYIPSPSPPKSPTRQGYRAKPRQALERKSLAASFKPVANPNKENVHPQSTSRSRQENLEALRKRSPLRTNGLAPEITTVSSSRSPVRARTPTPPRGRKNTTESPANSESSPPRGYAEAYQRIVEEENLASEDSIDNMELEGFDYSQDDESQEFDKSRQYIRHQSLSPVSLKSSRKPSPRLPIAFPVEEMDNVGNSPAPGRATSDSGCQEDITESSMDSGSSQHARDVHRLNKVLKSGNKAFSKARLGEKGGLSVENLKRRNGSNESLGSAFSAGSLSTPGSDPSVNIPKAWGRKAKPGKDWLNRINNRKSQYVESPNRSSVENHVYQGDEPDDARIEDLIAAASKVPLPESSSMNESSQGSTPRTAVQRNTPVESRQEWELQEDEFTGRSLQVSESPPIHVRHAVDRIRDDEIEKLEKRAVTTNRLGELRERGSTTSLRRKTLYSPQNKVRSDEEVGRVHDTKAPNEKIRHGDREAVERQKDSSVEEDGQPIPDTPIVIYKPNTNTTKDQDKGRENMKRPANERQESHDLLKRLAHATSESPSPTREQLHSDQPRQDVSFEETRKPTNAVENQTPLVTGAWVDHTLDPTPPQQSQKVNLKTPKVTGAWVDTPIPAGGRGASASVVVRINEQREPEQPTTAAAESIQKPSSDTSRRSSVRSQIPLKYTGPPLPKSALEEFVNEAKSGKRLKAGQSSDSEDDPTLQLGNSTIQSLEEFIENDTDLSTILAPTPPSQETSPPSSDPSPDSKTNKSSRKTPSLSEEDPNTYSNLLSRLTNLGPSLRASKRQLASLERTVSDPNDTKKALTKYPTDDEDLAECHEAGPLHDFIWPCQRCGCPGGGDKRPQAEDSAGRIPALLTLISTTVTKPASPSTVANQDSLASSTVTTLTIPIPHLWYWRRNDDYRPRLTWLGVAVFSVYWYLFAENWAQEIYCHPEYAETMVGYGVDINAPEPPFVLFKVIYRASSLSNIVNPTYIFFRTLVRLFSAMVGYVAGVFLESLGFGSGINTGIGPNADPPAAATREPVSRDPRIPRPEWGPDLSLLDDEYL